MRRFVIAVDVQRDFMMADGALYVPGAQDLVAPLKLWIAALHPEDIAGILFTFDTHLPETYAGSAEGETFPIHCVRGSVGWETVIDPALLDPAIPAWRMEKSVFDMWAQTGLVIADVRDASASPQPRDAFFGALKASGVEEVVVIGVAADYCVRWAIAGLVARGFRVIVPTGLTKGIERTVETVVMADFPGLPVHADAVPTQSG